MIFTICVPRQIGTRRGGVNACVGPVTAPKCQELTASQIGRRARSPCPPLAASRRPGPSKKPLRVSSCGANGQVLAFVYCEGEPSRRAAANLLTKDEARRIAANIAKLPDLLIK
jgi:hypothetical protein